MQHVEELVVTHMHLQKVPQVVSQLLKELHGQVLQQIIMYLCLLQIAAINLRQSCKQKYTFTQSFILLPTGQCSSMCFGLVGAFNNSSNAPWRAIDSTRLSSKRNK